MKTYPFALTRETKSYYVFVELDPSGAACTKDNAEINFGKPMYLPKSNFSTKPGAIEVSIKTVPLSTTHAQG